MKISLKYQLCGLISLAAGFSVGLLAIVTWYYSNNLVSDLRSSRLEVIAALKSKELTQTLLVYATTARSLAARASIANALVIPESHPDFVKNWTAVASSFSLLLSTYPDVLYVSVQNKTLDRCYLNITTIEGQQTLNASYNISDGILDSINETAAYNALAGAPEQLTTLIPSEDRQGLQPSDINGDGVFLGPVSFNATGSQTPTYVASMTVPVYNNTTAVPSARNTLGYMTVVFNIHSMLDVTQDIQGLGDTGQVVLLGPENHLNRWNNSTGGFAIDGNKDSYQYLLPPSRTPWLFSVKQQVNRFPVVAGAWRHSKGNGDYSGVTLETKDAFGTKVSVGYATVAFDATNSSFLLLVEQAHSETFEPMYRLRRIVIGCVFGTVGLILIFTFPAAHFAVRPIRRLHEATKLCGRPPEYREEPKRRPWWSPMRVFGDKPGWRDDASISGSSQNSSGRRDNFRIPQKVLVDRHFITDELTSLVGTFNAMTDELLGQYEMLEEKVRDRTEQLQQQTVLAESANEAKTMFIANVSHELRTPLNGILGMCSLVLEEGNLPANTRENLEVVFKSGQLLLHLLTDLITFSRNQMWGAQVQLENGPFRIRDFIAQVMALFGNQAKDKNIELTCEVVPSDGLDFVLIGDLNRILQVVINLISNSLKFTKEGGSIELVVVLESIPNAESVDITPYSDIADKPDYLSAPIFFKDLPSNFASTTEATPSHSSPSSPGTGSQTKPTRPPLFTRCSTISGVANTETEITKTFLNRSKKLLNPETAADPPSRGPSRPTSPGSSDKSTHMVEFRVIDTGPGVPEHMQQKIFEPFVQADVGLSRKYGGTGLGLSICQQLAKLMGGDIHLKSFEGAGSTFTLRIPMHFSAQSLSVVCSSEQQYSRPISLSKRSAHTTATRSMSAFSGPAFSGRSGNDSAQPGQDGNLRLVGLSQPFFVPSRAESEADFELADDSPPPHHENRGKGVELPSPPPMTPVTEVTTPGTVVPTAPEEDEQQGASQEDMTIRVLVVEDNKINQKLVVKVLQLEKVNEITVAEDGVEAVKRVQEIMAEDKRFDIIFMDIQMPNMDGLEATRQIRALGYHAPIVALTAFADESNIKGCYESGMDCFLSKPIKRPQIKQMVGTYCPGKIEAGASS
ncbi:hypothetical protein FN846DRAFT_365203 [Sphaerosporella brunnea]|uniref:histidine kinase n=1 Tax=Sphaerosporella brunnea TaxID=1250544 RepID=A0A5J5EIA7_9PEZI|nr:hypothetical protein FN846DRAFT_365203 [Sphaerosporella brunnea]